MEKTRKRDKGDKQNMSGVLLKPCISLYSMTYIYFTSQFLDTLCVCQRDLELSYYGKWSNYATLEMGTQRYQKHTDTQWLTQVSNND